MKHEFDKTYRKYGYYGSAVHDIVSRPGVSSSDVMRGLHDLSQDVPDEDAREFIDMLILQITGMHFMQRHKKEKSDNNTQPPFKSTQIGFNDIDPEDKKGKSEHQPALSHPLIVPQPPFEDMFPDKAKA